MRFSGVHERQGKSWDRQVGLLQQALFEHIQRDPAASDWGIVFEYELLRVQLRIDVVILAGDVIAVVEFKVTDDAYGASDKRQVEEYALSLRDFHETSHSLPIWPILCVTEGSDGRLTPITENVAEVATTNAAGLPGVFAALSRAPESRRAQQIDVSAWNDALYRPVPTIIQAAEALFAGHRVTEIAAASADAKNLGETTEALISLIERARSNDEHLVVFVTGVPGSGKTLVGLNAVHDQRFSNGGEHPGAYLSGNTPLVRVLQEALAADAHRRDHISLEDARPPSEICGSDADEFPPRILAGSSDQSACVWTMSSCSMRPSELGMLITESRNSTDLSLKPPCSWKLWAGIQIGPLLSPWLAAGRRSTRASLGFRNGDARSPRKTRTPTHPTGLQSRHPKRLMEVKRQPGKGSSREPPPLGLSAMLAFT